MRLLYNFLTNIYTRIAVLCLGFWWIVLGMPGAPW